MFKDFIMETSVNIYLTFNGNCRKAFEFYKSVFGGEFLQVSTFEEIPPQEGIPPVNEEDKNHIMHISMPISAETVLMGSDTGGEWAEGFRQGNNFSISVNSKNTREANRIFKELSKPGQITMHMCKRSGAPILECSQINSGLIGW